MPLYKKSEEWQHYTSLLLQARPTTTRITTKYTIRPAPSAASLEKSRAKRAARSTTAASTTTTTEAPEKGPRAVLELKTYCPESGVVLKYRTDKAAEVGRLIGSLGRMGKVMSTGLEAEGEKEDVLMGEADEVEEKTAPVQQQPQSQQGQQGGGKKKKKGKR
ncbi:hypothetical protein K461DRAFT_288975 [Myriangium duriaei CBS 260.36]|uniref:SRP9 domain-containing protein n=1 Tax=Myriangium duriaei CBS 260.36 TaxID=1168546 RepID=A0A9P4J7N0_9PEZI|nr:hypothetical protein K461DRAFT_288975 [Myriangium duriaei CBS 260.36]